MRTHYLILAVGLLLAATSTATQAESPSWTIRAHGAIVESSVGTGTSLDDGISSNIDIGGGFSVGTEYRLSDRFGLDFTILFAGLQIGSRLDDGVLVQDLKLSMMPLSFGVPFHFNAGGRVDLFVGPTFNIVRYLDLEWHAGGGGFGGSISEESDAALGAAFGLDVPLGKSRWAFSSGLRYMMTSASGTDVDPVIVMVGFAVRF